MPDMPIMITVVTNPYLAWLLWCAVQQCNAKRKLRAAIIEELIECFIAQQGAGHAE